MQDALENQSMLPTKGLGDRACSMPGVEVTESDFLKLLEPGPGDRGAGGIDSALGSDDVGFSMLGTPMEPYFFKLSEDCTRTHIRFLCHAC